LFAILAGLFLGLGTALWFYKTEKERQRPRGEGQHAQIHAKESQPRESSVPPKLINSSPPILETRPGTPGYDSYRLSKVLGSKTVFYQEPRDEAWAAPVETFLGMQLTKDLRTMIGSSYDLKIDCRTTICRISWTVPESKPVAPIIDAMLGVLSVLYFGSTLNPVPPNNIFFVLSGGAAKIQNGDSEGLIASTMAFRKRQLEGLQSGKITITRPEDSLLFNKPWPLE
jgi:hypothetical protein